VCTCVCECVFEYVSVYVCVYLSLCACVRICMNVCVCAVYDGPAACRRNQSRICRQKPTQHMQPNNQVQGRHGQHTGAHTSVSTWCELV